MISAAFAAFSIRRIAALLLACVTCAAYAAPTTLTPDDARHLLNRSGFAPSPAEVERVAGQSAERAVTDLLMRARSARSAHSPPQSVFGTEAVQAANWMDLKVWWLREMIESQAPLAERMTLFWHGHFATSQAKVRARAMWNQHELLRTHALGSFGKLLHGIAKDPAMLIYLDGADSRKEAPNENFAREVMELFTLGEATMGKGLGGYTEKDIKEAARAFTGWSVNREDFSFHARPELHDPGAKTVLGRTGSFDGEAVLNILLEEPATGRFIVTKLWKEFVSPQPPPGEVERIAEQFRRSNYDIAVAVRELLLSDAFWEQANRGTLVKSPIELVVGVVRQFGFDRVELNALATKAAQLGQNLFMPSNVKGWSGYTHWINATTLMERKRFAEQFLRGVGLDRKPAVSATPPRSAAPEPLVKWLAVYGVSAEFEPTPEGKRRLEQAMLVMPPTRPIADGTVGAAYVSALALDAAYQLK